MEKFTLEDWPTDQSFTIEIGDGKFNIAVFIDPNCPWCHRLFEESITKLNDIKIHVFLYPILGEDSVEKSLAILSSKDPGRTLLEFIMDEKELPLRQTERAAMIVDANTALGERLGLESVPAVFLANGEGPFGFMTATELVSKIEQAH